MLSGLAPNFESKLVYDLCNKDSVCVCVYWQEEGIMCNTMVLLQVFYVLNQREKKNVVKHEVVLIVYFKCFKITSIF